MRQGVAAVSPARDPAEPAERRVAEPRPADQQLERDRPVPPRVDRLAEAEPGRRLGRRVAQQPGLVLGQLEVALGERAPGRPGRPRRA